MALVDDLVSVRKMWLEMSFLGKLFIILSTFLAISPITSLSEIIFQWKGFILDGITFYRTYITIPLTNLFKYFGLPLNEFIIDYIIIIFLSFSARLRSLLIKYASLNKIDKGIMILTLFIIFFTFTVLVINFLLKSEIEINKLPFLIGVSTVIILMPLIKKYPLKEKLAYYTPILISIIFVLILAAINIGLNKPIS